MLTIAGIESPSRVVAHRSCIMSCGSKSCKEATYVCIIANDGQMLTITGCDISIGSSSSKSAIVRYGFWSCKKAARIVVGNGLILILAVCEVSVASTRLSLFNHVKVWPLELHGGSVYV